jgi:hypothetical protein
VFGRSRRPTIAVHSATVTRRSSPYEATLKLEKLQDLFSPPTFPEFGGSADMPSGIERLVTELKTVRSADVGVTVVVPDAEMRPGLDARLVAAIRAYVAVRVRDVGYRRAALRHEGLTALVISIPILVVLTVLEIWVAASNLPEAGSTAIDGLLVVLVWVALWYPLDTLFWYPRPLIHEQQVLRALETAPVTVRPSSSEPRRVV